MPWVNVATLSETFCTFERLLTFSGGGLNWDQDAGTVALQCQSSGFNTLTQGIIRKRLERTWFGA